MKQIVLSLALVPLLGVAGRAQQVLFTNFGPGFAYSNDFALVSGTTCTVGQFSEAAQFKPSISAAFQDAKLALSLFSGTNQVSVYLETDAGNTPGTIIEGPINVTGLVARPGSVITANSSLHPPLMAGVSYWLVAVAMNVDTCAAWMLNSTGDLATGTNFVNGPAGSPIGPWSQFASGTARPAFQIDGVTGGASSFQVRYASNLAIGDSVINMTNTGASSTLAFPTQNGNLCVNVYTFDPNEELISCCNCLVTPDALVSLSARNDLISNTLTPGVPTSIVVKLLSSLGGSTAASCNASTVHFAGSEGISLNAIVPGLAAWGTTLHALPVTPGTPATTYGVTETAFTPSTLSAAELVRITTLCGFIQTNGSGFGICKSCRFGGLGAAKQ